MYGDWEGSRIGSLHSFEKSVIKSYPYKDFRLFCLLCLLSSLEHAQRSSVYLYGDLNTCCWPIYACTLLAYKGCVVDVRSSRNVSSDRSPTSLAFAGCFV